MPTINFNRTAVLLFAALMHSGLAAAQKPTSSSNVPFVRVRWSDAVLHITYRGKKIDHDFHQSGRNENGPEYKRFWPSAIESVRTQRLLEKDSKVFVLLDVQGRSRGPEAANSYCGAGKEKALVLLQLGSEGFLQQPQAVSYESCLYTIGDLEDSAEDLSPPARSSQEPVVKVFSLTRMRGPADPKDFAANRDMVTVEVKFDPAHAELGLLATEKVEDYKAAIR